MNKESLYKIKLEIQKGIKLAKCRKCGCMKETLENLLIFLPSIEIEECFSLIENVKNWLKEMEPVKYSCLGCKHCFPAVAMNILMSEFPFAIWSSLICDFKLEEDKWPPVAGEYFAFCEGDSCPVAVSTLASINLAKTLAGIKPKGLCIVGKTETENIGIEKIIKNTITNSTIRFLIISGQDPHGHHSGETLLALSKNGVDRNMKVISSPGRRPILKNVSLSEVELFRKQVKVIDKIGCDDTKSIIEKIDELSRKTPSTYEWKESSESVSAFQISSVSRILAREPNKLKMDKAGYFVVIPLPEKKIIVVEHYAYDNRLLHIIEGKDAQSIYSTIIENKWITELSHAAYLGKELTKAEFSLKHGFKYIQDKALGNSEGNEE